MPVREVTPDEVSELSFGRSLSGAGIGRHLRRDRPGRARSRHCCARTARRARPVLVFGRLRWYYASLRACNDGVGFDAVPSGWGRCVVTIGVFDGVHRGHAEIIGEAVKVAAADGLPSVLITFDPHPAEVVRPGSHPAAADHAGAPGRTGRSSSASTSSARCRSRWSSPGSSRPSSPTTPWSPGCTPRTSSSGETSGSGIGRPAISRPSPSSAARSASRPPASTCSRDGPTPISATYIRSCVEAGDVDAAAPPSAVRIGWTGWSNAAISGAARLGFPTANLRTGRYAAVPADGVYAGRVVAAERATATRSGRSATPRSRSARIRHFRAGSAGSRPIMLDFDADLYGQEIGVEFVHRLRVDGAVRLGRGSGRADAPRRRRRPARLAGGPDR